MCFFIILCFLVLSIFFFENRRKGLGKEIADEVEILSNCFQIRQKCLDNKTKMSYHLSINNKGY